MKYWAKNGTYTWIGDYRECGGETSGTTQITKTYKAVNFWEGYDGTKSPISGNKFDEMADDEKKLGIDGKGGKQAFGFNLKNK
jgi:hypothetical protein